MIGPYRLGDVLVVPERAGSIHDSSLPDRSRRSLMGRQGCTATVTRGRPANFTWIDPRPITRPTADRHLGMGRRQQMPFLHPTTPLLGQTPQDSR